MFKKKKDIDKDGINEIIYLSKNILKLLFIILCISIVLVGIILLKEIGVFKTLLGVLKVLAPLFIGFVIAWLLSPLVNKLTKKGWSRIVASIFVYTIFVLFIVLLIRIFIPVIYNELNDLISTLPNILNKITDFINHTFDRIDGKGFDMNSIKDNLLNSITNYSNGIATNLPDTVLGIVSSLVSGLGTILFGLIIGLYMLFDFHNVTDLLLKIIPDKHQNAVAKLVDDIGIEVRKCVNGTLLIACMVFICDTVGFSIVGLKSALLFGLFCGITDLIPYIGPWIGTGVATIVGLTQGIWVGIVVFIIAIIVQLVESYILQPIVMSKATNLHPIVIICGLLVFGYFFGIIGMILATPIMSIIKVIWYFFKDKYNLFSKKTAIEEVSN